MDLFECILLETPNKYNDLVSVVSHYYKEYHRCYHDWRHIEAGASLAVTMAALGHDEFNLNIAQQLAWLFHDIVYLPHNTQNEVQSVQLLHNITSREEFSSLFDEDIISEASIIIMSTIKHEPLIPTARAIIDIDLHGFSDQTIFYEGSSRIKEEFGLWDEPEHFEAGQKKFLKENFLAKNQIYYTDLGYGEWERNARNILSHYISM